MIKYLLPVFLLAVSLQLFGQETKSSYSMLDISAGATNNRLVSALSVNHQHELAHQKFHIGYGMRLNLHSAKNQHYITAPAQFTLADPPQIDSARMANTSSMSLNGSLYLGYSPKTWLLLGFNIDLLGFTFGSKQDFLIYRLHAAPGQAISTTAQPTKLNMLLVGDNDRGTLNSEFYARLKISPKLYVRSGFSFFFSEYTSQIPGSDFNKRFRNKIGLPFVAMSFKL